MSSSFKFLNNASGESDSNEKKAFEQKDAAQSFLNEKLDKNRFTIAQQSTGSKFDSRYTEDQAKELDENGGPTVANASGDNPGKSKGTLAERYEKKFGSNPMSDLQAVGGNTNAANAIYANIRSLDGDDFWKKQDLTDLMTKAGHAETNGIRAGDIAARGGMQVPASLMGGINYEPIRGALAEKGWDTDAVRQNGISQMGSAMLAAVGDGEGESESKIEHSPEIKQAKERVRTYENDILSGKTSEDIYEKANYTFDATKGAAGIGTPMNGSSLEQASKATASFLDNKKLQIKDKYQFQAQG